MTDYTIYVQRNDDMQSVDRYDLVDGTAPYIESGSDRELLINKVDKSTPGEDVETFVALYAQGVWQRVWIENEED